MPRTKRGRGGRSRDPMIGDKGKQGMAREYIQCDAKLSPSRSFIKRKRKDGTTYSVLIERGERCPNEAFISKNVNGKTIHRCPEHIGGY